MTDITDTDMSADITTHLQRLGWGDYIPAFAELLQRFAGTEEYLEQDGDTLPACLVALLASIPAPPPPRLRLLPLRQWPILRFHAEYAEPADGACWDYRLTSFGGFCRDHWDVMVWQVPSRLAFPPLAQGLGFLRQHSAHPPVLLMRRPRRHHP